MRHHDPQARDANPEWVQGDVSGVSASPAVNLPYLFPISGSVELLTPLTPLTNERVLAT